MPVDSKTAVYQIGNLDISYDVQSGQMLRIHDRAMEMDVVSFLPGHEVEINELPLPLRLTSQDDMPENPAWQCMLQGERYPGIGLAQGYDIFRQVVVGSACKPWGNQLNPPNSLHIRYRFDRRQMNEYTTPEPLSAGKRPIQAPLWLDTIGTFCSKTDWFGPETKMIAPHFGANGPRSHVSLEDGEISEVIPHLWNMYRRTHPGIQLIPGAIYYHEDGRWLLVTCQRPSVGMHWDWEGDAQKAQFHYHDRLGAAEIVHTPEVSLYWGRGGKPEMYQFLSTMFIAYEEPQPWWYNTTWFWMLWWGYRPNGFFDMAEQAQYMHDELGITGFGLTTHDLRPGSWDCSTSSLRPSPHWGGEAGIRKFTETVKSFGGHTYCWFPWLGLAQPGTDMKEHWRIKGEDGRPYESFYIGSFDMYHAVNYNHPEVQEYYLGWLKRYITDYGVDGFFWDCGGSALPPDFSPKETRPFQRFPSECMTSMYSLMEKIFQTGRDCTKDFFMWHECFGTDLPGTGYSTHTAHGDFLVQLNRYARKRLVYRSDSTYNLMGGFPRINPDQDTSLRSPITMETYKPIVQDRMNRWVVKFVKEHGCRDAIGVHKNVSLCAGHLVVDPGKPREVFIPTWAAEVKQLRDIFSGEIIKPGAKTEEGATFTLPGASAFAVE